MKPVITALMLLGLFSCSTLKTEKTETPKNQVGPDSTLLSTWVHVRCINEEFTNESNLLKHENKFVVVPYEKLKTPAKMSDKEIDDTENLYFKRAAKMVEKVLTDAGLKKAKPTDKDVLTIGLSWNTKKTKLNRTEVGEFVLGAFTGGNKGLVKLEKFQSDQIYLSSLYMKAVGPNKKTTRWEITLESINENTFYLNVLPPLLAAGKDSVGNYCDTMIEKPIQIKSPDVDAIRNY